MACAAHRRLGNRRSPGPARSELAGLPVWLKREDLQRTGLFKERGARNALLCLGPGASARGVVTVTEQKLAVAVLARRCGAVVEGAGAAALAAVLAGNVRGRAVVVPVTGRNIDPRVHAVVVAATADRDWTRASLRRAA